jgi:hypothetical protein
MVVVALLLATDVSAQCTTRAGVLTPLRTQDGAPAYVDAPDIVTTDRGVALFGVPALRWWKPSVFFPPLSDADVDSATLSRQVDDLLSFAGAEYRLRDHQVRLVRTPRNSEKLGRPLAARNETGGIDVVFSSESKGEVAGRSATTLWHYELKDRVWSGGTHVVVPGTLYWSRESSVVLSRSGSTVALATVTEPGKGGGIVMARHDSAGWFVRTIAVKGLPYYLTATLRSPDTAVVVFGATDVEATTSNGSHLFQLQIALRDGAATTPKRVQWSERNAVVRPMLLRQGRERRPSHDLSLTWGIATQGATDADSLFVARSSDDGRTWRRPASVALTRPLTRLTSVMLENGTVATVGLDGGRPDPSGSVPRIYLARDSAIAVAPIKRLPQGVIDVTAGVGPASDALVILWTATKPARAAAAERAPYTGLAVTPLRCLGND